MSEALIHSRGACGKSALNDSMVQIISAMDTMNGIFTSWTMFLLVTESEHFSVEQKKVQSD